jgi:hypothetical protein
MNEHEPLTKRDLAELERDLKQFILEREIVAIRWLVFLQITSLALTLGVVWFLIAHWKPDAIDHIELHHE